MSTPENSNVEATIAAAGSGKPVLFEKPLAPNVTDASKLVELP